MFSIPYYSRFSLLPSDPSPFTVLNSSSKQSEQLPVTLDNYPLPDGVWRWVSKCWMIDMRTDSGEVQHDGFEYNWVFRSHKWRPGVGPLGAGGWVRRRRWVRLMMRPAQTRHERIGPTPHDDHALATADLYSKNGISESSLSQSSVRSDHVAEVVDDIWLDEDVERNWGKCRALMKRVGHDGRKLELWQLWLSQVHIERGKGQGQGRLTGGDTQIQVSPSLPDIRIPRRDQLLAVLKLHVRSSCAVDEPALRLGLCQGVELLQLFVYPDSRARMVRILGSTGLLDERLRVDFWSYSVIT